MRRFGFLAAALAVTAGLLPAHAGRPLFTDDAEPVAPGVFEVEAGLRYEDHPNLNHFDFPLTLSFGVFEPVELGVGFGRHVLNHEQTGSETSINDVVLGTKVKLLDAEKHWASQSLSFTVKFPTADRDTVGSGDYDFDLMWILTKPIGTNAAVHLNAGYLWVGTHFDRELEDLVHYGLAGEYNLTGSIQLVAEIFGLTSTGGDSDSSAFINGGLRWSVVPSLVLDLSVGHAFVGPGAEILTTIGLTWSVGPIKLPRLW